MAWTKEDRSFKTLINRRTTDSTNKYWYNEYSDSTINVHSSEIWSDDIDSSPAQAVTDGVAEQRTLFTLTLDSTVPNNQCYYAYESDNRLKDWISTKYGEDFIVHLYDNANAEIYPTDACQWFFDYQTGILTFNGSTTAFSKPFKISGYRYIGAKGGGSTTSGTSGTSGLSGTSGTSGVGIDGTSGTSGTSADGTSGSSGTSGIDGTSGTSGTNGTSGSSGTSGTANINWYTASSTSGEEVTVCASGTGVTVTRSSNTYTFSIPTGVRLISAHIRVPQTVPVTGQIIMSFGTGSSWTNRIYANIRAWKEDTGGQITTTITDPDLEYTKWYISGLGSTYTSSIEVTFHQAVAA